MSNNNNGENTGGPQKPPLQRPCIVCNSSLNSTAELLYQTEFWDFYYCPICCRWFQSSARDSSVAFPVKRKAQERALTLLYDERMQQIQSIYSTSDYVERVRRRVTLLLAKLYFRIARLLP